MQPGLPQLDPAISSSSPVSVGADPLRHHGRSDDHQPFPSRPPRGDRGPSRRTASTDAGSAVSSSSSPSRLSSEEDWAEELSWLNAAELGCRARSLAERIDRYENASSPMPRRGPAGPVFQVIDSAAASSDQASPLSRFPNEVLTHILSHLPPPSLAAVALVSHRFYDLVTTPHAWRIAFSRFFPGADAVLERSLRETRDPTHEPDQLRSERRLFARLTALASWRSEYVLRTRLIRSLARGKPMLASASPSSTASPPQASRSTPHRQRAAAAATVSATSTYNSQLLTTVNHLHATFGQGQAKRLPRFIHGADDIGAASMSDAMTGKVDGWGLSDPQSFLQFHERFPGDARWGLGSGEVVGVPNVMDVSQPYGLVYGEGSPGGLVYYRSADEMRGAFLASPSCEPAPELGVPKTWPALESICAVWMAKSARIPSMSAGLVGIMCGSSLGVISAYSLGNDGVRDSRLDRGELTARWAVSPGVPIVAIVVDEHYSAERQTRGHFGVVALNALGEVYCLCQFPRRPTTASPTNHGSDERSLDRLAWETGRSVAWELVEGSRRVARVDPYDSGEKTGRTPRSSSHAMKLSSAQLLADTKEIERLMLQKPRDFRKACLGWDMRRRLEVDFAGSTAPGHRQAIVVVRCGLDEGEKAEVRRFAHYPNTTQSDGDGSMGEAEWWRVTSFELVSSRAEQITTTSLDQSKYANLAPFEDPLLQAAEQTDASSPPTDIPGHRARFVAAGTKSGSIYVWNVRAAASSSKELINTISPVRLIHTDSPQISTIALSALYLVHGGNDGLVQAWDPLASSMQPIRTLNSRFSSRARRRLVQGEASPQGVGINLFAAGAICLDPDPTVLRGVVSLGTHLRYWSYTSSSTEHYAGRKRRLRRGERGSNGNGDRFSGSGRGTLDDYIDNERHELEQEKARRRKEADRLAGRFGVGLLGPGGSEDELMAYARLLSEEAYVQEEERRKSEGEVDSSDTVTPEGSAFGLSSPSVGAVEEVDEDVAEAIRLSLLDEESQARATEARQPGSPQSLLDYPVRYVAARRRRTPSSSPWQGPSEYARSGDARAEEELDLALQLSLADSTDRGDSVVGEADSGGKQKGKRRAT